MTIAKTELRIIKILDTTDIVVTASTCSHNFLLALSVVSCMYIYVYVDALGPPQQVRATVVSQTSINVTWSRPDGADIVDSYTVSLMTKLYYYVL